MSIGLAVRVFTNGQGDLGFNSISCHTNALMPPCFTLSTIRHGSRLKWSNQGKVVAPFPTNQCSSYWKGSFWVPLDYGCWLCFTWSYLGRYKSIFFLPFLTAFRRTRSLFLFGKLCILYLLFTSLSIQTLLSPSMIKTLNKRIVEICKFGR